MCPDIYLGSQVFPLLEVTHDNTIRRITSRVDPHFATDMLDELMCGFAPRPRQIDLDGPRVIHVHAEDSDEHWYLTIGAERTETSRTGDHADLTLTGTAADLYVLLWNRAPGSTVALSGDTDLIDLWHRNFRVRWG